MDSTPWLGQRPSPLLGQLWHSLPPWTCVPNYSNLNAKWWQKPLNERSAAADLGPDSLWSQTPKWGNAARTPSTPQYTVSNVPYWVIFCGWANWRGTPYSESLQAEKLELRKLLKKTSTVISESLESLCKINYCSEREILSNQACSGAYLLCEYYVNKKHRL